MEYNKGMMESENPWVVNALERELEEQYNLVIEKNAEIQKLKFRLAELDAKLAEFIATEAGAIINDLQNNAIATAKNVDRLYREMHQYKLGYDYYMNIQNLCKENQAVMDAWQDFITVVKLSSEEDLEKKWAYDWR